MPLPVSGPISFNNINVELGVAGTTQASLNQASYRALAGVSSGAISMSNFYGKANQFVLTIASNVTNANLATLATAAGWNGTSKLVATINSGVYCSSNTTGTPGLTVSGSFPGGVEITNNGFIIGMGGAGGRGSGMNRNTPVAGAAGSSGGLALSVSSAVSITNNGTIGGGGGGGGGGQGGTINSGGKEGSANYGGGGGGGGRSSAAANSSGGAGGTAIDFGPSPGTAGGAGTSASAGGGGAGGGPNSVGAKGGNGGSGGGWGAGGSSGAAYVVPSNAISGGGPYGGGAAGGAVSGNSNITWLAFGTRLGAIS